MNLHIHSSTYIHSCRLTRVCILAKRTSEELVQRTSEENEAPANRLLVVLEHRTSEQRTSEENEAKRTSEQSTSEEKEQ